MSLGVLHFFAVKSYNATFFLTATPLRKSFATSTLRTSLFMRLEGIEGTITTYYLILNSKEF